MNEISKVPVLCLSYQSVSPNSNNVKKDFPDLKTYSQSGRNVAIILYFLNVEHNLCTDKEKGMMQFYVIREMRQSIHKIYRIYKRRFPIKRNLESN